MYTEPNYQQIVALIEVKEVQLDLTCHMTCMCGEDCVYPGDDITLNFYFPVSTLGKYFKQMEIFHNAILELNPIRVAVS